MLQRVLLVLASMIVVALASPVRAQSRPAELRGAWLGAGYNRDWPAIMKSLRESGFNALFANFSTGCGGCYPSKVLPAAKAGPSGRDELAEAVKAAKQHGIELHVWRIDWTLGGADPELTAELQAAGRLQRNSAGKLGRDDQSVTVDWLCPSHPANRKLEKEAMLELARDYDIAGIQFDSMRFPSGDYCFCDNCRAQFQKDISARVERWPDDVQEGGPYAERWQAWRRSLITSLVRDISSEIRRTKPQVSISLAAWPDLQAAHDDIAQEWVEWVRSGLLDFVCPMDYTVDRDHLVDRQLSPQLERVAGAVPLYVGLGGFLMQSSSQLIGQIQAARELGADGFVVFALDSKLTGWLGDLRATVTAGDPDPMPHRAPPAQFSFSGPAKDVSALTGNVLAQAQLQVSITLGLAPQVTEEEGGEGAAAVAGMLDRAARSRSPVTSYDPAFPGAMLRAPDRTARISGRVSAETPTGRPLALLGAFDGGPGIERSFHFPAPEGPFHVAVYGSVRDDSGQQRTYVARSVLLQGVTEDKLRPGSERAVTDLGRLLAEACSGADPVQVASLTAAVQVSAASSSAGYWWLRFAEGRCECGDGQIESPDVEIVASLPDLLAMARGDADPKALWDAGRVTAVGRVDLLPRIASVLGVSAF